MPVVVGVFGLGFFAAHVYEVRSDLQRTAQRTAEYAASRCDPLAVYATTSGCYPPASTRQCGTIPTLGVTANLKANGCYRTDVELAQFATAGFFRGSRTGCFVLTGTSGLESIHASDLFDWGSRFASIGPSVSWPVFQGGAIRANIAFQNAAQEELLAAYQATVLRALKEVDDIRGPDRPALRTDGSTPRAPGGSTRPDRPPYVHALYPHLASRRRRRHARCDD